MFLRVLSATVTADSIDRHAQEAASTGYARAAWAYSQQTASEPWREPCSRAASAPQWRERDPRPNARHSGRRTAGSSLAVSSRHATAEALRISACLRSQARRFGRARKRSVYAPVTLGSFRFAFRSSNAAAARSYWLVPSRGTQAGCPRIPGSAVRRPPAPHGRHRGRRYCGTR